MNEAWQPCFKENEFCPIAFAKNSAIIWSFFGVTASMAVGINLMFDHPLLLGLYAYPLVFLGIVHVSLLLFSLLAVLLFGSLFLIVPPEPVLFIVIGAFALLLLIVKRIVVISERNYGGKRENEELLMNTMLSLAKTIDARDPYTAFHSHNVAEYARDIAKEMKLSEAETNSVYLAGLIHDIGKIGTPEHILQKENRLTDEEYAIMKKHPEDGFHIIKDIKRLQELGITSMVRHHHERMDGSGYPLGLKGGEIPLGARVLAVADAFDAMTTNRSYRQKLAVHTAAEELQRHSGTQFDPEAAAAFLKVLVRNGKLQREGVRMQSAQVAAANK